MISPINTSMAMMNYQKAQDSTLSQARLNEIKEDKALKEQTDQFESILLKFMLETAIKNDDTLYPKQPGSDIYHSMYIDELSQELSGSFGYSELLFNYLKEQQSAGKKNTTNLAQGKNNPYGQSK
ncbi:MAG: rod-binding protein [Helicobacter sp.]|nr:rod-binding protein [Helicobacter sp.]